MLISFNNPPDSSSTFFFTLASAGEAEINKYDTIALKYKSKKI